MKSTRSGRLDIALDFVGFDAQDGRSGLDRGTVVEEPFENGALFHGEP